MIIKELLNWITDYRDNLIKFLQLRLEDLSKTSQEIGQITQPLLTIPQVRSILNEIEMCNSYIDYLHTWDNVYNGPTIPFDNKAIIKSVEDYISKNH